MKSKFCPIVILHAWIYPFLLYKVECLIEVSATDKNGNLTCEIIHGNLTCEIIASSRLS